MTHDDSNLKSQAITARTLAVLGLLIWPCAVAGYLWGRSIKARSGGRYGRTATVIGGTVTVLGVVVFGIAILFALNL